MSQPPDEHSRGEGYEVVRGESGVMVRLRSSSVRYAAGCSALTLGGFVAAASAPVLGAFALVADALGVGEGTIRVLVALAMLPCAGLVLAAGRAARRKFLRDGGRVLLVGPDGRVTFGGRELVPPGAARAVWVEVVVSRGEDGDTPTYPVGVDFPGGPVWLPRPAWGMWQTEGSFVRDVGFYSRAAADGFAAAVARALGVPVLDKTA